MGHIPPPPPPDHSPLNWSTLQPVSKPSFAPLDTSELPLIERYNKQVVEAQERYRHEYEAVQQVHDAQLAVNARLWSLNRSSVPPHLRDLNRPVPVPAEHNPSVSGYGKTVPAWVIWCWLWVAVDVTALVVGAVYLVQRLAAR